VGVAASAALLGLFPAAAEAVPVSAELSVERSSGAEDCPDRAALATMIVRILNVADGSGLVGPGGDVRAEVQFARAPLGYRATLRLEGALVGERTLTDTGATCTALGRAVGITLALLLDPAQADPPGDAPPVVVAVSSPPPVLAPTATAPAGVTAGFLAVTGGSALGLVGPPSAAGGLELDLRFGRHFWLQVAGQYVTGRSSPFDTGSVEVALVAARLRLCGVLNRALARVLVAACLAGLGGQLRGEGSGFPSSNAAEMAWFGAGGGVQASSVLGDRWLLGAGVDLIAPLGSYTFSVENRGVAYRSNAVSATLQLSIGVKIW
jgi:hypothetical protein